MNTNQLLLAENEQPYPTRGQQPSHDAVADPRRERREGVYQMDDHSDQELPAHGGEPDAHAQGHQRAYGVPEFKA